MNLSFGRIARAIIVGILSTALIALWRSNNGSVMDSFPEQALKALAFASGYCLSDLLLARFAPRRRPARQRSIIVWALWMGMFVSLLFASTGLLNGADWAVSQWGLALVSGGVVGLLFGALLAWFWNAAYVPRGRTV